MNAVIELRVGDGGNLCQNGILTPAAIENFFNFASLTQLRQTFGYANGPLPIPQRPREDALPARSSRMRVAHSLWVLCYFQLRRALARVAIKGNRRS